MSHYKHLTLLEREKILFFSAKGNSIEKIAKELKRNKSTICRELKRNRSRQGYIPVKAQEKYQKRRKKCRRKKLLSDPVLYELVQEKFLKEQWSPEQIAGRLKIEHSAYQISHNTIYRAIYAGAFDTPEQKKSGGNHGARRKLRHKGKPRHTKGRKDRRGKFSVDHQITERPKAANNRSRRGDWEADTVEGRKGGASLVTLADRRSRYLVCRKITAKTAEMVGNAIILALKDLPVRSITPDRGSEFSGHRKISEGLHNVPIYFALPHHPWQRGTNENTNGLLREYFPKKKDLTNIDEKVIQDVERKLNLRPRKCLGFRTPYEAFFSRRLHLI